MLKPAPQELATMIGCERRQIALNTSHRKLNKFGTDNDPRYILIKNEIVSMWDHAKHKVEQEVCNVPNIFYYID